MNRYCLGKIYKIISIDTDKIYVGSTYCEKLCQRMTKHNHNYKKYLEGDKQRYTSSFEILQYNNAQIILIENYPCNNRDELRAREQFWIDSFSNTVNQLNSYISEEDKKQHRRAYDIDLRKNHPEKIRETKRKYRNNNLEKVRQAEKKYRDNHQDKIQKYQKFRNARTTECHCGLTVTTNHLKRHQTSFGHQLFEFIHS